MSSFDVSDEHKFDIIIFPQKCPEVQFLSLSSPLHFLALLGKVLLSK